MRKREIFSIFLLISLFFNYGLLLYGGNVRGEGKLRTSAEYNGISHCSLPQNVTFEVTINFSLSALDSGEYDFYFKFSLFDNRIPTEYAYTPPGQVSDLLYSSIEGSDTAITSEEDEFGNNYLLFSRTTKQGHQDPIKINQKYRITLSEVAFDKTVPDADIGEYNPSDAIHTLYCQAEQFYETNNAELIEISNDICKDITNPIDKADAIHDWIVDNLNYSLPDDTGEEKGAYWAYDNMQGDCSEFSDLMITLLRIQGIPARKCTGLIISDITANNEASPDFYPSVGDYWIFSSNFTKSSSQPNAGVSYPHLLAHAWLEYYVPNIGWIPSDPTWSQSGYDYFNRMDFLHLLGNIGAWFDYPGVPTPYSEFGTLPSPAYEPEARFRYTTIVRVEVIGLNLLGNIFSFLFNNPINATIFAFVLISVICLIIFIIFKKTGKGKKVKRMSSGENEITFSY